MLAAATSGRRQEAEHLLGSSDGYAGIAAALTDGLAEWLRAIEGASAH